MKSEALINQYQHLPAIWKSFYLKEDTPPGDAILKEIDRALNSSKNCDRVVLQSVLKDQYLSNPKIAPLIESLTDPNTFTVTTGHQLCLFSGPLYFIYKIASTIQLCKQLKLHYPDKNFIPVYWMATEDHDVEEINHVFLFNQKYIWETKQTGAVGRFSTSGIDQVIDAINEKKSDTSSADELIKIYRTAYAEKNLSLATRTLVHLLFPDEPLICLDADDARLKKLFMPIMQEELQSKSVQQIVQKSNDELNKKGFNAQVNPREINLFYLNGNERKRILSDSSGDFSLDDSDKKWTNAEILDELNQHPENFSPNVLMRPLYQEVILPNIAYIGGPGELSYWLQLTDLFKHFSLTFPALIPRNSFMIVDGINMKKITKLELSVEAFFRDVLELEKEYVLKHSTQEIELKDYKEKADDLFTKLAVQVAESDVGLKSQVLAEQKKFENYLFALETKLRRAEKQKHEQSLNQLHAVKEKLFPQNTPQERYENISSFYWKYGKDLIQHIVNNANPLDASYRIIFPDEQ